MEDMMRKELPEGTKRSILAYVGGLLNVPYPMGDVVVEEVSCSATSPCYLVRIGLRPDDGTEAPYVAANSIRTKDDKHNESY